jgi:predicted transcriptional regulator
MKRLTASTVEAQLRRHRGNLSAVARAFGVTRTAVADYVRRRPELQAVTQECREAMKDGAESALYDNALAGEAWAVCFFLKTQARDRGYGDRLTVAGDPGAPLAAKVYVADDDFDPDAV